MQRILVIGATGRVGREVVSELAKTGSAVRALSRGVEPATTPRGIEAVRGDLTVPETLDPALNGVDAVFLVWTAPAAAVPAAMERITRHARRIVYLSAPLKTPHPLFQQPNAGRAIAESVERSIEESGAEWTFLRPGMFASNALEWWAPQIRADQVVRWPYLSVPSAPIDPRDIAAVAVRALTEGGHRGAEYVMTGPEALTHREQIETIGRAIGKSLTAEEMSPDEARREWSVRWPPFLIEMLLTAWGAAAGRPAWITSTVEDVTGRPARRFFDWAGEHAGDFGATRSAAR
jgi:uncharacterized protein YbjT (DUF2867 family)